MRNEYIQLDSQPLLAFLSSLFSLISSLISSLVSSLSLTLRYEPAGLGLCLSASPFWVCLEIFYRPLRTWDLNLDLNLISYILESDWLAGWLAYPVRGFTPNDTNDCTARMVFIVITLSFF